jgi:hypothetical protein
LHPSATAGVLKKGFVCPKPISQAGSNSVENKKEEIKVQPKTMVSIPNPNTETGKLKSKSFISPVKSVTIKENQIEKQNDTIQVKPLEDIKYCYSLSLSILYNYIE